MLTKLYTPLLGAAIGALSLCWSPTMFAGTEAVSRTSPSLGNDAGNSESDSSRNALSADGCRSVFSSGATNLVPGQSDLNGTYDVFLHDCATDTMTLLSRRAGTVGATGNRASTDPIISADGSMVVFSSRASDLVDGLVKDGFHSDLYLYDVDQDLLQLVNVSANNPMATSDFGAEGALLSNNGEYLVFSSSSADILTNIFDTNNGPDLFHYETATATTTLITEATGFCLTDFCTGNAGSGPAGISNDGQFVAFTSQATNLMTGQSDTPGTNDIFLWDRSTGLNTLVSHTAASTSTAAGERSENPAISGDGNWVAYTSWSIEVVPGQDDLNGDSDVFIWERASNTNTLVSHLPGQPGATDPDGWSGNPTMNSDGSLVAFTSISQILVPSQIDPSPLSNDLFVHDRLTDENRLISHVPGNLVEAGSGSAIYSRFSADGEYLVFVSRAGNLVPGQIDGNDYGDGLMGEDVFRHHLGNGVNELLSHVPSNPAQAGRFMSFIASTDATASNVLFVSDSDDLSIAIDGNDARDIYKWSASIGEASLISRRDAGADPVGMVGASEAVVSAGGNFVAFTSKARNVYPGLVVDNTNNTGLARDDDIFLLDRSSGEVILVSASSDGMDVAGNDDSRRPRLSGDGRYVAFESASIDIVPGQIDGNGAYDIFLFDRLDRSLVLLSRNAADPNETGNGASFGAEISRDGRFVVFSSTSSNLVPGGSDTNGASDVFLYEIDTDTLTLVSRTAASATTTGNGDARHATISTDGRYIAFESGATNHVSGMDFNNATDIFLYDRDSGGNPNRLVSHQGFNAGWSASASSRLPQISADGRFIAYLSEATDLLSGGFNSGNNGPDVFLFDREAGFSPTSLVSRLPGDETSSGDGPSSQVSISDDGSRVAFLSTATNLVEGQADTPFSDDVFLFDAGDTSMRLVSQSASGSDVAAGAERAVISGDGTTVLFDSRSSEIINGLIESTSDSKTYLYHFNAEASVLISRSVRGPGTIPRAGSLLGGITPDGAVMLFLSTAPDIVSFDGNSATSGQSGNDVFLFERGLGIPVIDGPVDQFILQNQSTGAIEFSVEDPDGAAEELVLSASSSNQSLISTVNILFQGSGNQRTVEAIPSFNQNGEAMITLRATDVDGNIGVSSFMVFVEAVNSPPELQLPPTTTILEDQNTGLLDFMVTDADHDENDLLFTVSSSDPAIVPHQGIALAGFGTERRIRVTPAEHRYGEVTIMVRAEDPDGGIGEESFLVIIINVNDPPSFVAGGDIEAHQGVKTVVPGWATTMSPGPFEDDQVVTFDVVTNSAPELFSEGPQVSPEGTLTFVPSTEETGSALISIVLRDDGGTENGGIDVSAPQEFTLTVLPENAPPTIIGASSFRILEDPTGIFPFLVDDAEDGPTALIVEVESSDHELLSPSGLVLGGSDESRTLSITPAPDTYGTASIAVTVTDSQAATAVLIVAVAVGDPIFRDRFGD